MKRPGLYWLVLSTTIAFTVAACRELAAPLDEEQAILKLTVPAHIPAVPVPADNPVTLAKVDLGRKLFNDPVLSLDSTISCGSCHFPEHAFSDPRRFSLGVGDSVGKRQAMPLFNLAYANSLFWDGRKATLEEQSLAPILDVLEMHFTPDACIERLKRSPDYVAAFQKAFGGPPTVLRMQQALATFERTLLSFNTPYDRYIAGDTNALTLQQKRGYHLFNNEAECFHCHIEGNGQFTDFTFQNNGLYEVYPDAGRFLVTNIEGDEGKFKVPSLRNVAFTAPYMHDGSMQTLEEVVAHYASRGKNHPNKSIFMQTIVLSPQDQADVVAFLHALSDEAFIAGPH